VAGAGSSGDLQAVRLGHDAILYAVPVTVVDMISVAEESNNLETVLVQIADTNEARTARAIDLAVRVIEPLLLVVMASIVFCIAVALLLPILTMGGE